MFLDRDGRESQKIHWEEDKQRLNERDRVDPGRQQNSHATSKHKAMRSWAMAWRENVAGERSWG